MTVAPSPEIEQRKRNEARFLSGGFVLVFAVIMIDIIARNFGPLRPCWAFYVTWEAASILFTFVVTPIYWKKYIRHGEETAYSIVMETADHLKVLLAILIGVSAISLVAAGVLAFCVALNKDREDFGFEWMLLFEAGCLVSGVMSLVCAELLVLTAVPTAREHAEEELAEQETLLALQTNSEGAEITQKKVEKWRNLLAEYKDIADDIGKALAFSDAPIAIAFGAISLIVFANALGWMGDGSKFIPPFIAGAVAFQLLYSNFVFYLEANGAFPRWARKMIPQLDLLTPMIRGYPTGADSRQKE